MTMKQNTDRISIQVGLSGYSFRIEADSQISSSEWMSSDRVFTTPEFQKRYDEVEIAVFTPKFALVPSQFYSPENKRSLLTDVTSVGDEEPVDSVEIPEESKPSDTRPNDNEESKEPFDNPDNEQHTPKITYIAVVVAALSLAANVVLVVLLINEKKKSAVVSYDPSERTDFDIDILE